MTTHSLEYHVLAGNEPQVPYDNYKINYPDTNICTVCKPIPRNYPPSHRYCRC